jgi:hypothetical protein
LDRGLTAFAMLAALGGLVSAQLPTGLHTLNDTLNNSTGEADASNPAGGVGTLKVTYSNSPGTSKTVTLAWDGGEQKYVNPGPPPYRFYWVVIEGVKHYWLQEKDASGWTTISSGTIS